MDERKKTKVDVTGEVILGCVENTEGKIKSLNSLISLICAQADVRTRFSFPSLPEVKWGDLASLCDSLLKEISHDASAIRTVVEEAAPKKKVVK